MRDNPEFEPDRVRAHTPEHVNSRLDRETEDHLIGMGLRSEDVHRRLSQLDREWDMERVLETNAGLIALAGAAAGAFLGKRWLAVPGVVFGFLLQHAVQGWCPPVSVFRRLGIRTRREVNRERYALKAMRGDFDGVIRSGDTTARI